MRRGARPSGGSVTRGHRRDVVDAERTDALSARPVASRVHGAHVVVPLTVSERGRIGERRDRRGGGDRPRRGAVAGDRDLVPVHILVVGVDRAREAQAQVRAHRHRVRVLPPCSGRHPHCAAASRWLRRSWSIRANRSRRPRADTLNPERHGRRRIAAGVVVTVEVRVAPSGAVARTPPRRRCLRDLPGSVRSRR